MKCTNCGFDIVKDVKFCPKCGAKAPVAFNPATEGNSITHDISAVWPEWKAIKQLGRGSFGTVYEAVRDDNNVESRAAIKIISIPSDPSEIETMRSEGLDEGSTRTFFRGIVNDFVSEIRLMESLKGIQNIVSVEDYKVVERSGEIGWDIYIRMELLTPFNTYIQSNPMTESQVIKLGRDICAALEICAKKNIIHRDIKPENIFVNEFGHYKLGDFGIARTLDNATGGLSQKGTFNYMAPEVVSGTNYDARADIYSLGIVLYRLLNGGRLPFLENEQQVLSPNERRLAVERRLQGETLPAPKDASPAMAEVILRACAHSPEKRYTTATEMAAALSAVASGSYTPDSMDKTTAVRPADKLNATTAVRPAPASAPKAAPSVPEAKKKKPVGIIAAIIALLVIAGCVVGAIFLMDGGNKTKDEADVVEDAISDAEDLLEDGDPAGAVEAIDSALADYPDNEELLSKRAEYVDAHVDVIILNADVYLADLEYTNAINDIDSALEKYPDNAKLLSKRAEYVDLHADAYIADAEKLSYSEGTEAALNKINDALDIYPDNEKLLAARKGYADSISQEKKSQILNDAESLADNGDYLGAMAIMKDALDTYGEDADYQNGYDTYEKAFFDSVIARADESAKNGDYQSAISIIEDAIETYGESETLSAKIADYKQMHVSSAIAAANALSKERKFDEALSALNAALEIYPDNEDLKAAISATEEAKAKPTEDVKNPNQRPESIKDQEEHNVNGTHNKSGSTAAKREDVYHSSFDETEKNGEEEWFHFTTSSNYSSYEFKLLNNSVDTTLYLTVYDAYDKEIGGTSAGKGGTAYYYADLEVNTKYWVKINRYRGDRTGNYQFEVNEKLCDAGLTKEEAYYTDLNALYTKELDTHGFDDWYRFTATGNYSTYQFILKNNSIDTVLYLTVYDEYDTELGSTSAGKGNNTLMDLKLPAGKEYKVKISRYNNTKNGYYQFGTNEMVCDAGLTKEEAHPLKIGQTLYGTADTTFEEWYTYTFAEDGEYTLKLTNHSIDTTVYATVYDILGTDLGTVSAGKGNTSENSLPITSGTVLYVKITRHNNSRFGNYALSVN